MERRRRPVRGYAEAYVTSRRSGRSGCQPFRLRSMRSLLAAEWRRLRTLRLVFRNLLVEALARGLWDALDLHARARGDVRGVRLLHDAGALGLVNLDGAELVAALFVELRLDREFVAAEARLRD